MGKSYIFSWHDLFRTGNRIFSVVELGAQEVSRTGKQGDGSNAADATIKICPKTKEPPPCLVVLRFLFNQKNYDNTKTILFQANNRYLDESSKGHPVIVSATQQVISIALE